MLGFRFQNMRLKYFQLIKRRRAVLPTVWSEPLQDCSTAPPESRARPTDYTFIRHVILQGLKGVIGGALGGSIGGLILWFAVGIPGGQGIVGFILGGAFGVNSAKIINQLRDSVENLIAYFIVGGIIGFILGNLIERDLFLWIALWSIVAMLDGFILGCYVGLSGYIMPFIWGRNSSIRPVPDNSLTYYKPNKLLTKDQATLLQNKDDILTNYRPDEPLNKDEVTLLQNKVVAEHLAQDGVLVEHRREGCYLTFSEGQVDREPLVLKIITVAQKLQEETDVQQKQRSLGAWCLALRLALAIGGERAPNTLTCLNNLAGCLDALGRAAEALPLYQQVLAQRREVLGERHPDTLESLSGLAQCLESIGQLKMPRRLYELKELYRLLQKFIPKLPPLDDINLMIQPFKDFQENILLGERRFSNSYITTKKLITTHSSVSRKYAQEALRLHQEAFELRQELLGEYHPQTLKSFEKIILFLKSDSSKNNWLSAMRNDVQWLLKWQTLAFRLACQPRATVEWSEQVQRAAAIVDQFFWMRRNIQEICRNFFQNILNKLKQEMQEQEQSRWNAWKARKYLVLFELLFGLYLKLLNVPLALFDAYSKRLSVDWGKSFQALSRAWLEVLDLQPPEQLAVLRDSFQHFHYLYLNLCLRENRPDLIPVLLAAFQGRQLAALMLDELAQTLAEEAGSDTSLREHFLALRRQLRQAALGLGVLISSRGRFGGEGDHRPAATDRANVEVQLAAERQRLAEYDALYRQYHELLQTLRQANPDFAIATPTLGVEFRTLQERLSADEALVLLVHKRFLPTLQMEHMVETKQVEEVVNDHDVALKEQVEEASSEFIKEALQGSNSLDLFPMMQDEEVKETLLAFLLTAHDHRLLQLGDELLALPAQVYHQSAATGGRAGLRYTGPAPLDPLPPQVTPSSLVDWATMLGQHFWQPLIPALSGTTRLHLVSHGDFHALPYTLGGPPEVTVYTYPGLLFYYQRRHLAPRSADSLSLYPSATAPLGLHCYDAADHPDLAAIPLVGAEIRLVADLWPGAVHTPLTLAPAAPVTFLHMAGHGDHPDADPLSAGLVLGPSTLLDCRALFRSTLRPRVVFLSACVVGRTREDLDGEPLGLVSTFLLRGAEYVIAPLQPVSDTLMPLLACLFHQAWQQGLPPPQALAEAKRRLAVGDWYPDTADRVRAAYTTTLNDYLPRLLNETDLQRRRQGLKALQNWPLPPDYAYASLKELRTLLASPAGRDSFIAAVLDYLIDQRSALPVAELLPWVVGFGGPRP